ncbi:SGT1 protein-domain-containing protein [Pilaira anomala]|nr:SGT1 protein-domain-containing protein [Pilaira anomala]
MINSNIQPLIKDYIWQKDRFHLSITYDQHQDPRYPFLFGLTRFGDCLNDEWFIVYLLKSISLFLPESAISLVDNDGDVLLIEAAHHLPYWLDPSNSENRVYLYEGKVHIIPLASSPADILQIPTSGKLLRERAIDILRKRKPVASKPIQDAIDERVQGYPSAAKEEIHRANCLLPTKAAFVLLSEPQLITLAIEAFYLRDPISMKACASMNVFSPVNTVETTIRFTKTTYAQTISQKFYAPKPFRLPAMNQKRQYKYAELGMKVACGLEMLYYNAQDEPNNESNTVETYKFESDKKYLAYVDHLKKLGYFRSERPGSQLYKVLELQSKQQYLLFKSQESEKRVVALDDIDIDDEDVFEGNKEDTEDWMNVDPKQLEELLMKRMGHMKDSMMDDLKNDFDGEDGMDLEAIMSNLENFVENSKSGVDGVEFPKEVMSEEEEEDSEYEEDEYEGPIKFDMDKFMSILKGESSFKQQEEDLTDVMEEMDQELSSHDKLNNSFAKLTTNEEENEDAPVDIQLNLVKNVLESFKSQQGLPGPVSNLLNQFGLVLPADNEQEK